MRFCAIILALCLGTSAVSDTHTGPVRHATAEWLNFTNRDGSGLYNEVFREVFAAVGTQVDVSYMPLNRAVSMVESGEMDFTGGFTPDTRLFATHPVYVTTFSLMVPADSVVDCTDPDALAGLSIVGPTTIQAEIDFPMTELDSRAQAAQMLISGRADAYLDLHELLQTFLETGEVSDIDTVTGSYAPLVVNQDDWKLVEISTTGLYMLFTDSDRGAALRDMYDTGTEILAASGKLAEIYDRYGITTPTIIPRTN